MACPEFIEGHILGQAHGSTGSWFDRLMVRQAHHELFGFILSPELVVGSKSHPELFNVSS